MRVSSHVDSRHFTDYRTYDWGPSDALPAGDPRFERNPYFQDHVQGAIERHMAAKGFERAATGAEPDVRLHFHAVIDRRMDVNLVDYLSGYCDRNDCAAGVSEYDEGTLVIDLIDVQTNRLVWRGWAQDNVEGLFDNPDRLAHRTEEAVRQIFTRLPSAR
jgi:hypothetical protein